MNENGIESNVECKDIWKYLYNKLDILWRRYIIYKARQILCLGIMDYEETCNKITEGLTTPSNK